jgi:hypothetical protein
LVQNKKGLGSASSLSYISLKIKDMGKRSTHYGDVKKWIEKVIDSCETYEQTCTVKVLIYNFTSQMGRKGVDFDSKWNINHSLTLKLQIKRDNLLKW